MLGYTIYYIPRSFSSRTTLYNMYVLRDHPCITSAIVWSLFDPPIHYVSINILYSIFRLADTNQDDAVSIDEMMNFILHISNPR